MIRTVSTPSINGLSPAKINCVRPVIKKLANQTRFLWKRGPGRAGDL
jgi:hypothetical protein